MSSKGEETKKDVTIRGVDAFLYSRAAEIAKRTGKTMGEVVNEALRLFIDLTEGLWGGLEPVAEGLREAGRRVDYTLSALNPTIISDLGELEVTKEDLEQLGRKVVFQRVKRLSFADDVDAETFERYVALIRECEEVRPPKGVSKLLVLSRCRKVDRLIPPDGGK
ncbi:MAG: hypothetical protein QI199_01865 [Candidatus Korarchaeota archaeon]|nr:hypothetical protein [Candidatus Korarchaeota archaeon]